MQKNGISTCHPAYAAGLLGVEAHVVTVQAEIGAGPPCLEIGGPDGKDTSARVRAALAGCGQALRPCKQVVTLAPAPAHERSGCDLAIACALLVGHGVIPSDGLARTIMWGELDLNGTLRPAAGALVVADMAQRAGFSRIILDCTSARQVVSVIPGIEVVGLRDLAGFIAYLRGEAPSELLEPFGKTHQEAALPDFADVRGLALPRKAIEIMLAGGHNLLLHGPSGAGKTMIARRVSGLLPPLDDKRALEVTKVHAVARRQDAGLIRRPAVRMPHHTVSTTGLLGGGSPPRPGEVSLAHAGVLFLDELPEFSRAAIEGIRDPLVSGVVTIVRARYALHYPARFQLLAAMTLCPCGFFGHPERVCTDSATAVQRYQSRVSRPILDHIDLVVPVTPMSREDLARAPLGEPSARVRERIVAARARQATRLVDTPWERNAELPVTDGQMIEQLCPLTSTASKLLREIVERHRLGARENHRLRRLARTIVDLGLNADLRIDDEALAVAFDLCGPGFEFALGPSPTGG